MTKSLHRFQQKQGKANSYVKWEKENAATEHTGPAISRAIGVVRTKLKRTFLHSFDLFHLVMDTMQIETTTDRMITGKIADGTLIRGKNINGEQWLNWEQMFWQVFAFRK